MANDGNTSNPSDDEEHGVQALRVTVDAHELTDGKPSQQHEP
jgi:hypothetical protein